jgi:hypothetical protein
MKVKYSLFSNLVHCPCRRAFVMTMMDSDMQVPRGLQLCMWLIKKIDESYFDVFNFTVGDCSRVYWKYSEGHRIQMQGSMCSNDLHAFPRSGITDWTAFATLGAVSSVWATFCSLTAWMPIMKLGHVTFSSHGFIVYLN